MDVVLEAGVLDLNIPQIPPVSGQAVSSNAFS